MSIIIRGISYTLFLCLLCVSGITQQCNNWLRLPSLQSYVSVGDLDIAGNKITLEAVFTRTTPYMNGQQWAGDLISKHNTPSDNNYLLRPNGAEITTTNGFFQTPNICEIELNKTYHVAMTYDGTTLKFYRNGFLMSSIAASGNLFQNNFQTRMGLYDAVVNNTQLVGFLNEARIWNVVRTQAQIRAGMSSPLPTPSQQTGLLAYYTFNDLLNKQGNPAWDGTLGGLASINQTNPNCAMVFDSCGIARVQESIINDYTEAISLEPCKNKMTVANSSDFKVGDTVLLIQMKGATIDATNTASFGTVTNYQQSGNYEFNYVKAKNGNELELLNIVQRAYDFVNGKVQLVRVPYYQDLAVDAVLTCMPWDGSKGGILAFNVANTLQLKQKIDVSGKGFKGGIAINTGAEFTNCFENRYSYAFPSILAARKGESIAELPNSILLGKGAAAGAGGGGIDHNSGAGGGGNGGAGGFGGYQYEPCGSAPFDNRGIGGYTLPYSNAANKIFLGSGGGAGHENNGVNAAYLMSGGNGGGLIIISAQQIISNGNKIISNGDAAPFFLPNGSAHMHEAMGGGGSGGTILLNISQVIDNTQVEVKGGKGGDMTANAALYGRIGPGGGGGGGVFWSNAAAIPANITVNADGGAKGVLTTDNNNPWGTTDGQPGASYFDLQLPITQTPFKPNIDSVRIGLSVTGCTSIDFTGLGYVNTNPVAAWQWYFGDGNTGSTRDISHTYATSGMYTVKLVITDVNGCKDSISTSVTTFPPKADFDYKIDICDPLSISFKGLGTTINPYWDFGDGATVTGISSASHTFATQGDYLIKFATGVGSCIDTAKKIISVRILQDDIVLTRDTTICYNATKQLRSVASLDFCWSPVTYLDNPNSANPITSTTQNITYFLTSQVTGANLVVNGNFLQGNTGFTSAYQYSPSSGLNPGVYNIGSNITAWHPGMSPCNDHTSGNGNMMMVNGASQPGVVVWSQTVTVQPNTNYAFSTWLQHITTVNPAQLQFSINGKVIGSSFTANSTSCIWNNFFATWNSGTVNTAVIAIVNQNQVFAGNDFALDDISFAPVITKRDSVKITVDNPKVIANKDTTICTRSPVQLLASGADSYLWSPSTGVSNPSINNPQAMPAVATQYIVAGTTVNGCTAKDTVNVAVFAIPALTVTNDTTICKNIPLQLSASGGNSYSWSPANMLSDPAIANPLATPSLYTLYNVLITDNNLCTYEDSVKVTIRPDPVFAVNADKSICNKDSIRLLASGGDVYSWQPSASLSASSISNPVASPIVNTTYSVTISEAACHNSVTLTTAVSVRPLPDVQATKSNDIDCSSDFSQLNATGAVTYTWNPSASLSSTTIGNPIARPQITTQYIVKGKDISGCTAADTVTVEFKNTNKGGYLMPNAFTPDNNGRNDCYGVKYWGVVEKIKFSIYNRWGERIYYTTSASQCWDGTYKGIKQDPGVYVYMIEAKTNCDETVFRKGTFVLIR